MQKSSPIQKREPNLMWQVATLAGPIVLQNLSQTLLGVVDTFFVSRIGTEAVAAVGLAGVIYFAVLMLFRSTAFSTIAFVGRAYGEGDYEKVGSATLACHQYDRLALPERFDPTVNLCLADGFCRPAGRYRRAGVGHRLFRDSDL